ncbi:DUF3152 domain-containing protein [Streptomyces sp. H28]|uniref:DUF3152 domain-containing protein n=1 Tax=Streptomyces sp. H28 TaxID=2775865 RepID=UPI003EC520EB
MGRHSRRGPAPKGDAPTGRDGRPLPGGAPGAGQDGRAQPPPQQQWPGRPGPQGQPSGAVPGPSAAYGSPAHDAPAYASRTTGLAPGQEQQQGYGQHQGYGAPRGHGGPEGYGANPVHGPGTHQGHAAPYGYGAPAQHGPPAYGTPPHGVRRYPDGTPAHGVPRYADGTPAQGVPRLPDGTPAHGTPRLPDGTPAHGVAQVRGGHPEQRDAGGGWGQWGGPAGPGPTTAGYGAHAGTAAPVPRQRQAPSGAGPRQDYLAAFDAHDDVFTPRTPPAGNRTSTAPRPAPRRTEPHASDAYADPYASVTEWADAPAGPPAGPDDAPPTGEPAPAKASKGRAFTGIAAAAITTVLAVVVAGQVADDGDASGARSQSAADGKRDIREQASRGDDRETPAGVPEARPLTYEEKMGATYALKPDLAGSGKFDAIRGVAEAPGKGQKITYRVDVEQGLDLDGELFAEAVQKTLNDERSWAHQGARTFERIHSGRPDFVITLASPGTTAEWCAKSGLDTTVDNVSCDSAATERVMINAYRWAQGAEPYGDKIHAYRQMLINHEIGHRLGYGHVTCDKDGDLAPVMQQQTKFVDHDGIDCRPNPWPYPNA